MSGRPGTRARALQAIADARRERRILAEVSAAANLRQERRLLAEAEAAAAALLPPEPEPLPPEPEPEDDSDPDLPRPRRRDRGVPVYNHGPEGRELVEAIVGLLGGRCLLCGTELALTCTGDLNPDWWRRYSPAAPTIEHVTPRGRGGRDAGNRLVAHRLCNEQKAARMPTGCELIWLDYVNTKLGIDVPKDSSYLLFNRNESGDTHDYQGTSGQEAVRQRDRGLCPSPRRRRLRRSA